VLLNKEAERILIKVLLNKEAERILI